MWVRSKASPAPDTPAPARAHRVSRLITIALALTVMACQGGGQPSPSPKPSPTPTVSFQEKQAWRNCGATTFPPAGVAGQPTSLPQVANSTGGVVSEAEARTWTGAFMREQVIETWAQTGLQEGLLQRGCLGDPTAVAQLFGEEISMIRRARQAHARVTSSLPRIEDVRLVPVPADVQARVAAQAGARSPYALIVHGRGPAQTGITYPDGRQEVVSQVKADEAYYAFYGGEYRAGSQGIGPLWYQKAVFNCQQPFLRSLCGI
jgi:hypothetical protein